MRHKMTVIYVSRLTSHLHINGVLPTYLSILFWLSAGEEAGSREEAGYARDLEIRVARSFPSSARCSVTRPIPPRALDRRVSSNNLSIVVTRCRTGNYDRMSLGTFCEPMVVDEWWRNPFVDDSVVDVFVYPSFKKFPYGESGRDTEECHLQAGSLVLSGLSSMLSWSYFHLILVLYSSYLHLILVLSSSYLHLIFILSWSYIHLILVLSLTECVTDSGKQCSH